MTKDRGSLTGVTEWVAMHKPLSEALRGGLKNGDLFGGTWRISHY